MKLGYYNPQLKVKQIIQGGKVVGNIVLTHTAYGYTVKLHYFDRSGYAIDQCFNTEEKAVRLFDKAVKELSER